MPRFVSRSKLFKGASIELLPTDSRHFLSVLRGKVGQPIELMDGAGRVAQACIVKIQGSLVTSQVESVEIRGVQSNVHVAFGIPKGKALDFIFHRCTEIGVGSFQPIETKHSLPVHAWNNDRWSKVVIEVCKQCEELFFPEVLAPVALGTWLTNRNQRRKLVFCDESERLSSPPVPLSENFEGYDVLVGPEGGWSSEERGLLHRSNAAPLGLGRNRLRAENALLVAVVLIKYQLGELLTSS